MWNSKGGAVFEKKKKVTASKYRNMPEKGAVLVRQLKPDNAHKKKDNQGGFM